MCRKPPIALQSSWRRAQVPPAATDPRHAIPSDAPASSQAPSPGVTVMNRIRVLVVAALALGTLLAPLSAAFAQSATGYLYTLDKTTWSGALDVRVDLYPAPDKYGKVGQAQRYPAKLLFQRPDRFRMVLRPGEKNEYRAVAEGGIVRWLDVATGVSGKDKIDALVDPLAVALLGTAGELTRFGGAKDLPLAKGSKLLGATLAPKGWGSRVTQGLVWLSTDGKPVGYEFRLADGRRVFVAVLGFQHNPQLPPDTWKL
jgi:outer membrane lipoprotein-sorting protein